MRKLLAVALLGIGILAAADLTLTLDPTASSVTFTLGDVLHTVHGTFRVKQGTLHFDPATGKLGGEVVVDAASGESGSGARDSRMKKNILEVGAYPNIVFRPDRVDGVVSRTGTSNVQVHGNFEIHGKAHEVTIPASVTWSGSQMTTTMHFEVPYVKWGMKNPSTLFLRVDDKVVIDLKAISSVMP